MKLRMDSTAENCLVKTLDAVFSYYNNTIIPEHVLVAAGEGLLLAYGKNLKEDGKGVRPHLGGFAGEGFLVRASAQLGLEAEVVSAPESVEQAKERILQGLGKGELNALVLDEEEMAEAVRDELKKSRAKVDLATNFHIVVPVAFDPAAEQVTLWMASVPETAVFQVPLTDLATTWCHTAKLFPRATVVWRGANAEALNHAALFRRTLPVIAHGLLGQGDLSGKCFLWLKPQSFGCQALLDMADDLPNWPEMIQPYERCRQHFIDMLTIKADVGYVFYQLSHLLDDAAKVLEVPLFKELSAQVREIGQDCEIISNLFFKAGFSKQPPQPQLLERMAERLRKMAVNAESVARQIVIHTA